MREFCVGWKMEGAGYWPPFFEARAKGISVESEQASPFCQDFTFSVVFQRYVCTSIVGLFEWSCPTAIAGMVGAIIVDALDTVGQGFWSHVGEEGCKGVEPGGTDGNTSCPVDLIFGAVFLVAAFFHIAPCFMFFGESLSECWGPWG